VVTGNIATGNGGVGIMASSASTIAGNTAVSNASYGLFLSASTAYRDNLIDGNSGGAVSGGVNAGGNVCNGSLTCP
jgi:nitrous oxidase accessory protein NosD